MATPSPIISLTGVTKRYPGNICALSGVSFEISEGECVCIAGKSGAGKSTLIKLIAAIERPSSGTVLVSGQNLSALRRAAIPFLRRNLGLVLQDHKLLYDRSVFDNVVLPLRVTGQDGKEAARRARAALDKVGLLTRERANPLTLSGGEQQRLCIARAVVNRPSILIADEPTANLDQNTAASVMEIFRSFHQVGVTLVIASHDQGVISRMGARVLTLSAGLLA